MTRTSVLQMEMHDMDSELILYTTEDGVTKVDATFVDETVWLTQEQMADLFKSPNQQ